MKNCCVAMQNHSSIVGNNDSVSHVVIFLFKNHTQSNIAPFSANWPRNELGYLDAQHRINLRYDLTSFLPLRRATGPIFRQAGSQEITATTRESGHVITKVT